MKTKTQNITLSLPNNFNIYDHVGELKSQGFMLLSYLIQMRDKRGGHPGEGQDLVQVYSRKTLASARVTLGIKTKDLASKLKIHVSTLRRWLKKLIDLSFVTAEKGERDPGLRQGDGESKKKIPAQGWSDGKIKEIPDQVRDDGKSKVDPFDHFMEIVCVLKERQIINILNEGPVDLELVDLSNKTQIKGAILSHRGCMDFVVELYRRYEEQKRMQLA